MNNKITLRLYLVAVLIAITAPAYGVILVNEDFSGLTDPLSYFYQDPNVSTDSFSWNSMNQNMSGVARRGMRVSAAPGTAEMAFVSFNASGFGNKDPYLAYDEAFSFQFDFNFSSFADAENDERLLMGLWYSQEDAEADNAVWFQNWATRQHFVGASVKEDGTDVRFNILFGNGGNWVNKSHSDDLTGDGSLSLDTNYRIIGQYRYDGVKYGQVFGRLIDLDSGLVIGVISQELITQDTPDIYSVGYVNFSTDTANRQFTKHSIFGVANETWGTTRLTGAEFTSDNWHLVGIPEPGTFALAGAAIGVLAFLRRRK